MPKYKTERRHESRSCQRKGNNDAPFFFQSGSHIVRKHIHLLCFIGFSVFVVSEWPEEIPGEPAEPHDSHPCAADQQRDLWLHTCRLLRPAPRRYLCHAHSAQHPCQPAEVPNHVRVLRFGAQPAREPCAWVPAHSLVYSTWCSYGYSQLTDAQMHRLFANFKVL